MIDDKWIKELSSSIFDLVQTHSGGMKLTELVANLDLSRKYCKLLHAKAKELLTNYDELHHNC